MRALIAIGALFAATMTFQPAANAQSSAVCALKPNGITNCMYQTMHQCQNAALSGTHCVPNARSWYGPQF